MNGAANFPPQIAALKPGGGGSSPPGHHIFIIGKQLQSRKQPLHVSLLSAEQELSSNKCKHINEKRSGRAQPRRAWHPRYSEDGNVGWTFALNPLFFVR
jgi:hypothetical protein